MVLNLWKIPADAYDEGVKKWYNRLCVITLWIYHITKRNANNRKGLTSFDCSLDMIWRVNMKSFKTSHFRSNYQRRTCEGAKITDRKWNDGWVFRQSLHGAPCYFRLRKMIIMFIVCVVAHMADWQAKRKQDKAPSVGFGILSTHVASYIFPAIIDGAIRSSVKMAIH